MIKPRSSRFALSKRASNETSEEIVFNQSIGENIMIVEAQNREFESDITSHIASMKE